MSIRLGHSCPNYPANRFIEFLSGQIADSLERFGSVHDVYFLAVGGRCGQFLWSVSTAFD
jgi:hypothetical protein